VNKRARLTRRILREHRRGDFFHLSREWIWRNNLSVHSFWSCPHCEGVPGALKHLKGEVPRAYR